MPKYTYVADGAKREIPDELGAELGAFQRAVDAENARVPAEPIKVIPWVECFLKARLRREEHRLAEAKYEEGPTFETYKEQPFDVLDVSDEHTRNLLLKQLVDLASVSSGDAIHVDDHLSYEAGAVPDPAKYQARLTAFVRWLVPEFKRLTGKLFELSCSPPEHARKVTQADVLNWPVDRIVVQAYKRTANDVTSTVGWRSVHGSHPKVSGIGATCFGYFQDKTKKEEVSNAHLIEIMKHVAKKERTFVLWHIGDLLDKKRALVESIAALAPPLG